MIRTGALFLTILALQAPMVAYSESAKTHGDKSREIVLSRPSPLSRLLDLLDAHYTLLATRAMLSEETHRRHRITKGFKSEITSASKLPAAPENLFAVLLGAIEKDTDRASILGLLKDAQALGTEDDRALATTLLSSPLAKRWEKAKAPLLSIPPVKDTRTDEQATWLVEGLFEQSAEGEYAVAKGRGLSRVPLDEKGKEQIPAHRLVVRFDPAKKGYLLHLSQPDGSLLPLTEQEQIELPNIGTGIPGVLLHEGRQVFLVSEGQRGPNSPASPIHPKLHLQFRNVAGRLLEEDLSKLFGKERHEGKGAKLVAGARELAKRQRDSGAPIAPMTQTLDLAFIEIELGIGGAATPPRPLDFAWLDGSTKSFLVVDEQGGFAYHQSSGPDGRLRLQRYHLRDPREFGYPGGAVSGHHIVLARRRGQATGLDDAIPAEDQITRGWVLQSAGGEIVGLSERRAVPPFRLGSFFGMRLNNVGGAP